MARKNIYRIAAIIILLFQPLAYANLTVKVSTSKVTYGAKSRILAVGDSLTVGGDDSPVFFGYRDHLQDILGIGAYDFIGPYTDPDTSATYDVDHAGVGGEKTADVLARLPALIRTYLTRPVDKTYVLLCVGSNDVSFAVSSAVYLSNLEAILDDFEAYDLKIKLYVALIPPRRDPTDDTNTDTYNANLLTKLQTHQLTNSNLVIVNMNAAFKANSNWATDYLFDVGSAHPTDLGYTVMAQTWNSCMQSSSNTYCNGH